MTALTHLPTSVMVPAIVSAPAINELYVFGDSLSDTGTIYRATGGMYPPRPYFQGRYSNGQVWVEYLARQLNLSLAQTSNFAYGGATTNSQVNAVVPSLLTQVASFTKTHPESNANALYVIWAGANDYLQGTTNPTIPVESITQAIVALKKVGARRFLVANLPDLGQIPATRWSTNSDRLSTLTSNHNQTLRRSLKVLNQKESDLQLVLLDVNTLYQKAISSPADFGFATVNSACLSGSRACTNPDQFLFWDDIHPTTAAHRIIGEKAFSRLAQEGLVEPQAAAMP